jgi:protein-disulfide isomerase
MDSRKILVLSTAVLFLSMLAAMTVVSLRKEPISIEVSSPVFGNQKAPVELVVFEDFKCYGCKIFSETILPQIESEYLSSNQIKLKVIPLGFLEGSKILANAALEVYTLSPERFPSYAKLLFSRVGHESIDELPILLNLAKELGGIDLFKLKSCIERKCHYPELERNLDQARMLMGKKFRLPALFINGVRVKTTDLKAIRGEIEKAKR